MPENCTTEQFKQWRHHVLVFLEAHPKWAGAKRVINHVRKGLKMVDSDALEVAVDSANSDSVDETGKQVVPDDGPQWSFTDRTKELYQLISVKLNSSSFADYKDEDSMNGFELWRILNRAKDPVRKDISFHLELAIQQMASSKETSFDGTYAKMLELEKASKSFKSQTG